MNCPNCNKIINQKRDRVNLSTIYKCSHCKAIFGDCYLGDSYNYVLPRFSTDNNPEEQLYFDFTCLGSEGVTRRHGWYNPVDNKLTQVG